jgi:phosphoribosylcarboxyaminoimidazole (NCAIR) mutase
VSFVSILMGSESDMDVMKKAAAVLDEFGIENETHVISAHRKPRALVEYISREPSHAASPSSSAVPGWRRRFPV